MYIIIIVKIGIQIIKNTWILLNGPRNTSPLDIFVLFLPWIQYAAQVHKDYSSIIKLNYIFLIILTKCPSMNIKPYAVVVLFAHIWNIALYYRIECLTTSISFVFLTSNFIWCGISEERHTLNPWYKCNLKCSKMCYIPIGIILLVLSLNCKTITADFCWSDLNEYPFD